MSLCCSNCPLLFPRKAASNDAAPKLLSPDKSALHSTRFSQLDTVLRGLRAFTHIFPQGSLLFPSPLVLQSILSLMLTICLSDESPLRPGLAPPPLGLGVGEGSSASFGSGSGDGEPVWPLGDSASPTPGDVSQDQSVCLWQRVPGCPLASQSPPLQRAWKPRLRKSDHSRCPPLPPLPAPAAFPTRSRQLGRRMGLTPILQGCGWEPSSCS